MFFFNFRSVDPSEQNFSGGFAHQEPGLGDRCQLHLRQPGNHDIIESDKTDILRDLVIFLQQVLLYPQGDHIISAEDRIRFVRS